ncbi:MAG: helix-hairpin-helix domain-containing protein [Bacteroidota bacterium]
MNSFLLPLFLAFALSPVALAQPVPGTTGTEAEAVLEDLTDDEISGDPTDLLELLADLRENPLDINTAPAEDLALVPAFSPLVAETIVRFRETSGPFGSIPELRSVEGVTEDVFFEARPYLRIGPELAVVRTISPYPSVPSLAEVRAGARVEVLQRLTRRLDLGEGFDALPDSLVDDPDAPTRFAGSPERIYTRVRATYRRNVSANVTLEKDPGEQFTFEGESVGYDFASFHLAALRVGRIEALVVGDYVAEFGQGLALWRAAGFGKGRASVRPLIRRGRGLRPYGSTDENRFFRGVGATVAVTPALYLTAFGSRRALDASFNDVDTTDVEAPITDATVAGLPADGLHRTPSEIARKDALGQTLFGGGAEVRFDRATVGVVGYSARFDNPVAPGERPFERFDFAGDAATVASAYANVFLGTFQLFGEVASSDGVVAGVGGAEASLDRLDAVVLARHYPRDFASLHGYAFGERNGRGQNETGLYLGLKLRPARRWVVSGFFDQYRFPWVRFAVPRPATGHEALLYVEHTPRRWLTLYAQGRTETRETAADFAQPTGAVLEGLVPETRRSLRVQGEYLANRDLRFRTRIEGSHYRQADQPAATGVLLFQDVRWQLTKALRLDARLTFFDTEGFDARLYQFENDLTGVFANTLLFGRGTRTYAMLSFRPGGRFEGLDLRAKLASTRFEDRPTVSSGLSEIDGPRVRDLALQLRYRFGG